MTERDLKVHQFQVEAGEPVYLIRGNDPDAEATLVHLLARRSVAGAPVEELEKLARVADAMKEWKRR